ncbi:MAG: hypothetical protein ACFCGT_09925 [Sandaracinaceae bacterium]
MTSPRTNPPARTVVRRALARASAVIACALLGACGGQAFGPPTASHPALMTDSDRYAAALYEAYDEYAAEVDQAAQFTYPTPEAARSAALAVSAQRFDQLLDAALAQRGLTRQGLTVHAAHHPEFVEHQQEIYRPRLGRLRQRAVAIADQVPASSSWAMALLEGDDDTFLAAR